MVVRKTVAPPAGSSCGHLAPSPEEYKLHAIGKRDVKVSVFTGPYLAEDNSGDYLIQLQHEAARCLGDLLI